MDESKMTLQKFDKGFKVEGNDEAILFNFFATWCPPCKAEIPHLNNLSDKFKGKLKKQNLGAIWTLELVQNDDVLGSLADFKNVKKIGFKMETDAANAMQNAKNMLEKKSLNAVCLNVLVGDINFGSDSTQITFITRRDAQNIALTSKEDAARQIVNLASKL